MGVKRGRGALCHRALCRHWPEQQTGVEGGRQKAHWTGVWLLPEPPLRTKERAVNISSARRGSIDAILGSQFRHVLLNGMLPIPPWGNGVVSTPPSLMGTVIYNLFGGGDQTRPAEFQPYTTKGAAHKYIAHAISALTYRWILRACTPCPVRGQPARVKQTEREGNVFPQGSPTRPCRLTNAIEIHHPVLHRGIDWGKGSGCFRVQCPMEHQARSPTLPPLWRSSATHSHSVPIGEARLDTASGGLLGEAPPN